MSNEDYDPIIICKRIKLIRNKRGFNQSKLARKSKITQSALSMIEKGENIPSSPVLRKIAISLKVTTDYLLGNTEESKYDDLIHNNEIINFFNSFKGLSEKHKELILEQIEYLHYKNDKIQAALEGGEPPG